MIWTRDEILKALKKLHKTKADLSYNALAARRQPLVSAAAYHFGSYRKAVERAGIDYAEVTRRPRWTRQMIIGLIKDARRKGDDLHWSAVTKRRDELGKAAFATGVLLLLVGRATKLCERLMDEPKQYEATVKLGATTPTDDPESAEVPWPRGAVPVSVDAVRAALPPLVGEIVQRPPAFSALKVGGQRAYDLARDGKTVELQPRRVRVYGIELLDYAWPLARLRVDCGRGTYVRAIARDLGETLNVGGHLTQLRRTLVGPFRAEDAMAPDGLMAGLIAAKLCPFP